MNRREALKFTTSILGVSIVGADAFLSGCIIQHPTSFLSIEDILLLDEIGEIILPESDRSPGAKAVHIGEFMNTVVTDCYNKADQNIFKTGLEQFREAARNSYRKEFMMLNPKEQYELVKTFDVEAKKYIDRQPVHFFSMIKQLTIWGFFSSKAGVTIALRYDPAPGNYDGCVEYREGDKAWYGPLSSIG